MSPSFFLTNYVCGMYVQLLVYGQSVGSGPSCYLAATKPLAGNHNYNASKWINAVSRTRTLLRNEMTVTYSNRGAPSLTHMNDIYTLDLQWHVHTLVQTQTHIYSHVSTYILLQPFPQSPHFLLLLPLIHTYHTLHLTQHIKPRHNTYKYTTHTNAQHIHTNTHHITYQYRKHTYSYQYTTRHNTLRNDPP